MKKKTDSTISLPVWAQLLLPVLVTVLCAGIVLLCSIRPYEQAKTYLKVAFMAGSTSAAGESTNGLNIVQTDIDTDYTGKTDSEGTPAAVAFRLRRLGLLVSLLPSGGSELLEQGACLTTASALLGASGNSVISGHVNTFFHDLSQLQVGDTVTAYTTYGKFTYEVTEQIQFESTSKSYLKQTDDDRLTLYTCEMQLLGSSSKRVGVICKLTDKAFYTDTEAGKGGTQ